MGGENLGGGPIGNAAADGGPNRGGSK